MSGSCPRAFSALALAVLTLLLCWAAPSLAAPIPEGPEAGTVPDFFGAPAVPEATRAPQPPRHPFMAPNGRSNIHNDAYQTDSYEIAGPLGSGIGATSTFQGAECASVTFDSAGRIVSICVGVEGPRLVMFDPATLEVLAEHPLPPRSGAGGGDPFSDFSGGGYFYLDNLDRAVIPTNHRHIWVVGETDLLGSPGFRLERDYDVSARGPAR